MISSTTNYTSSVSSYYLNQVNDSSTSSSASDSSTTKSDDQTNDQFVLSEILQQLMSMMNHSGALTGMNDMQSSQDPLLDGISPQGTTQGDSPDAYLDKAVQEKQADFDADLKAKLEAAGVDTNQDISLGYDENGNIVVTSNVSAEDKSKIESVLANDKDLSASYKELKDFTAFASEMEDHFAQGVPPQTPSGMEGIQNINITELAINVSSLSPRTGGGQNVSSGTSGSGVTNMSSVASAYAANSTLPSNSSITSTMLQQLLQALSS